MIWRTESALHHEATPSQRVRETRRGRGDAEVGYTQFILASRGSPVMRVGSIAPGIGTRPRLTPGLTSLWEGGLGLGEVHPCAVAASEELQPTTPFEIP